VEEVWGLLGFGALMCIRVYFHCCSGGACVRDCRGLEGVYSWYSSLVSGW
jgi:hypothetical protein